MHVLVIGGAGYIGSHVSRLFLDRGHAVTVFDNLANGHRENLFGDAGFIHGDILQPMHLRGAMEDTEKPVDAVVHLAAAKAAGESMLVPEKYAEQNITGTINVMNAIASAGIRNFVFSSSAAVYGEPEYVPLDENHPTRPVNFYGFTKLEIERILGWYDRLKGIRSARLRYFNAAGYDPEGRVTGLEANPANLLPVIMEVAVGRRDQLKLFGNDYDTRDGTCVRDYIHVTDLAAAHLRALEWISDRKVSLTVNLGSEVGVTVTEMIDAARRITGTPVPTEVTDRRPGDPAELVASSGLARETLGWEPEYSDIESLVETSWKAYRTTA